MLIDFRLCDLRERAVGVLFFVEGGVEQFHRVLVTELAGPGLQRAVP